MSVAGPAVHRDPDVMGGALVFVGTRVPFQTLLDYLEGGESLDAFLDDFPTVGRGACCWRARTGQGRSRHLRCAYAR